MATTVIKKNALSTRFQTAYRQRSNGVLAPILAMGDDVSAPIGLTHMPANGQAFADIGGSVYVPFAEAVFNSNLTPITKRLTQRLRQAYKALPGGALAPVMVFGSNASNPVAIPSLKIAKQMVQPYVEVATGIFAPFAIAVMNEGATVIERDLSEEGNFNLAYKPMGSVLVPIVVFGTNTSSPVLRGNKVEDQRQAFVQLSPGLYAPFFALFQDNPVEILTPVNTGLPTIQGTMQVGQTINLGNGTWTNSPTGYARKLRHVGETTSLATGTTYVVQQSDLGKAFELDVVATNAQGDSPVATSLASNAVIAAGGGGQLNSKPRVGVGSATAASTDPAALLASMVEFATGANASKAGNFSLAPPTGGQFGWTAFEAGASAAGVTFTDDLGTGGWQGAGINGPNFDDDLSSPNTSNVTATVGGVTWRFFRQSYAEAGGTFATS